MQNTDRKNMVNDSKELVEDKRTLMESYNLKTFTPFNSLTLPQKEKMADFLYEHLEQYGDKREDIMSCLSYAMKETSAEGGFVLMLLDGENIIGAVVVNKTGMSGYIPENILVYIAMHNGYRGQGLGKYLMESAIKTAEGDVALHVEPDNPAKFLYEKIGFTSKYLEMRYKKESE